MFFKKNIFLCFENRAQNILILLLQRPLKSSQKLKYNFFERLSSQFKSRKLKITSNGIQNELNTRLKNPTKDTIILDIYVLTNRIAALKIMQFVYFLTMN